MISGYPISRRALFVAGPRHAQRGRAAGFQLEEAAERDDGLSLRSASHQLRRLDLRLGRLPSLGMSRQPFILIGNLEQTIL